MILCQRIRSLLLIHAITLFHSTQDWTEKLQFYSPLETWFIKYQHQKLINPFFYKNFHSLQLLQWKQDINQTSQ